MPKEFLIFSCGEWPQGKYTKEVVEEFVNRFNATKIKIPVFVGHKYPWDLRTDADEFSQGEIKEIRINQKGDVYAVDYFFNDYIKEAIVTGKLIACSPEVYGDGTKKIDIAGLALLGRSAPQNPFALLPQLFGQTSANFNYLFQFELDKSIFSRDNEGGKEPMTEQEKKDFEALQAKFANMETQMNGLTKNFSDVSSGVDKLLRYFESQNTVQNKRDFSKELNTLVTEGKITAHVATQFSVIMKDEKTSDEVKEQIFNNFSSLPPVVGVTVFGQNSGDTSNKELGAGQRIADAINQFSKQKGI